MVKHDVFVFGTLMYPNVRECFLEPGYDIHLAQVSNYKVVQIPGAHFPACIPCPGNMARGEILSGLTDEDMEALDDYEGVPTLYRRGLITARFNNDHKVVWAYHYLGETTDQLWLPDKSRLIKDGNYV